MIAHDSDSGYQPSQGVIVEWYYYDEKWTAEQVTLAHSRVEELAQRFSVNDKPTNLRVFDCIGYIRHPKKNDQALLYKVPVSTYTDKILGQPVTLFEILSPGKVSTGLKQTVSLENRFRLAALLATSILELHNVNWLHKNLNSYNLLFFTDGDGNISFTEPYITGFDFSRPDRPGQKSLTMRPSLWDIYRHPDVLKVTPSSQQLQSYQRKYDVFSLGLILFEIGLWRRLDGFTKPNLTSQAFQTRIETYVERDMSLWMGDTYKRVVQKCLSGDYLQDPDTIALDVEITAKPAIAEKSDHADVSGETENARELSGFYRHVVAELGRCQCGVANGQLL